MGLDMYLYAEKFLGLYDDGHESRVAEITAAAGMGNYPLKDCWHAIVSVPIGYWRKANAIHDWFVRNVQDGEDDCGHYTVEREQLETLLSTCRSVIADPQLGPEILPTRGGFFFGSTEYDEWYMRDVQDTIDIIEAALQIPEYDCEFKYHSSW